MALEELKRELSSRTNRWLVTGVAGFIGSHLAEFLLRSGQEVIGIDNFATGHQHNLDLLLEELPSEFASRFQFFQADIVEPDTMARVFEGVDYVLHQAALGSVPRSVEQPLASNHVNVNGFLHVLDAARRAKVRRVVYASSSSVYGDNETSPKLEETLGNQLSPYAVTKRVNELYAWVFEDCYGLECVGLRYFNVFGPRQDPNGAYAAVIPRWVDALRRGETCIVYGDGETSRDFCYIDNVVQANILAAVREGAGVTKRAYNVALGERTSLNQLYAFIREEVKSFFPERDISDPHYEPFRAGDIRHSLADISVAVSTLGYQPTVPAKEGIRKTVAWFLGKSSS